VNANRDLVMKNMSRVWEEINLGFRELGPHNTLLIDDCPYKCIGNVPYSYILPHPFDYEVVDTYLLDNLWPYLARLFESPSTIMYISKNPHRQEQFTRQHPN